MQQCSLYADLLYSSIMRVGFPVTPLEALVSDKADTQNKNKLKRLSLISVFVLINETLCEWSSPWRLTQTAGIFLKPFVLKSLLPRFCAWLNYLFDLSGCLCNSGSPLLNVYLKWPMLFLSHYGGFLNITIVFTEQKIPNLGSTASTYSSFSIYSIK